MDSATAAALLALNHQFYQTFALQFSATRQRIQPGVQRLLPALSQAASLLDLGCGNGELARRLVAQGFRGRYVGLDFSPGLLQAAGQEAPPAAQIRHYSSMANALNTLHLKRVETNKSQPFSLCSLRVNSNRGRHNNRT